MKKDYATQLLGKSVTVKIDRPMGTKHPKHNYCYPVNYGYIEGTTAPDREELDAYVLGVFKPTDTFTGKCIAVIHRDDDNDDKLIVVPEGINYPDEQIRSLTKFQERFFKSTIIKNQK